ncbi:hypothetical protein FRC00_004844 [Tulasnella sp. 408]|nr:hypothetical protein FRC00_004844 [Tulasnella sp. 408]
MVCGCRAPAAKVCRRLTDVTYRYKDSQISDDDIEAEAPEQLSGRPADNGAPFPVDPDAPPEHSVLTWRSVLIGSFLGLIVGASNIYLGLKTGFSFGASLFGAIFGFAVLKPMSNLLSDKWGGGYFGPKENCTVQSAATASGGLTTLFVAAVPAMYHLGLMTTPQQDMGKLFLLTTISAFYGLFFAVPLRKYYIPYTIQSLHATSTPSARRTASKKINIIGASFIFALVFKTFAAYVPGLFWDWHIFWVMVMLVYSFVEVLWSSPMLYRGLRAAFARLLGSKQLSRRPSSAPQEEIEDPAPPHEQIKTWQWVGGLILSSLATLIVGKLSFDMDFSVGIVALFLAFVFSFIGVQSSGTTDVNPVGTIAKASQLVIGGITKGQGIDVKKAQKTNLLAGALASQAASHSVDMVGDLKTGHLLGASPASQFWAQVAGSFLGIWLSVILFVLFASAYPCVTDLTIECTAFGMPAVTAWRSVTEAVTKPELPIPPSSAKAAIVLGIAAAVTVPIKYLFVPEEYRAWVPNWSGIGLGFVVPQAYYPIAMVIGAHIAQYWESTAPASWEIWGYSLSAGLIAGEGIGGMVTAILVVLNLDGKALGTGWGCPQGIYCG